jgi:hypothetical protein
VFENADPMILKQWGAFQMKIAASKERTLNPILFDIDPIILSIS